MLELEEWGFNGNWSVNANVMTSALVLILEVVVVLFCCQNCKFFLQRSHNIRGEKTHITITVIECVVVLNVGDICQSILTKLYFKMMEQNLYVQIIHSLCP